MTRRRPIDHLAVARIDRKADQLAIEHPEAFDPARLPTSPGAVAAMLGRKVGRPPADDPMLPLHSRLPASLVAKLDAAAVAAGLTRSGAIRTAVERWLKRRP